MSDISILLQKALSTKKAFTVQLIAYESLHQYTAMVTLKNVSPHSNTRTITCTEKTAEEALEKIIEKLK